MKPSIKIHVIVMTKTQHVMKSFIYKLLIGGIISCISFTINAQVKHTNLSISQPKVDEYINGIENTVKDYNGSVDWEGMVMTVNGLIPAESNVSGLVQRTSIFNDGINNFGSSPKELI